MNKAIVTSRTLKNTETGIDITVPEFRSITKLLSTQEEFHVIIISSLPYFKSPDHKEEDVVQFMVPKWYSDFESLHKAMSDRYPATIFPDLPKKLLMVRDSTPQERRVCFEKLMQFIAASPKVCCSPILLEFLGVPPSKISAVEGKTNETESGGRGDAGQKEKQDSTKSPTKSVKSSQSSSLFGEDDSDDELFKSADKGDVDEADSDLFTPSPRHAAPSSKGVREELVLNVDDSSVSNSDVQDSLFLPAGSSIGVTSSEILGLADEDNSDLLNVEEDLDKLLTVSTKPKPAPKPTLSAKPTQSGSRPPVKPRPSASKPSGGATDSSLFEGSSSLGAQDQSEQMEEDDIMKYILENSEPGESKLDLF